MRHESMIAYLPQDRVYSLATGIPLAVMGNGAALFADISGFTPLTEALARTFGARRGAEELTRQLNQVYDALNAEIDRYRGAIIGFSGDAVTCWFESDDDPADGPGRAVSCAFALQQAMQAFARVPLPNGDTVTLTIKAAVATGPVWRFAVGDPAVQVIEVLVGDTVIRMAEAEHHANKGEVIVDEQTITALPAAGLQIGEWRGDPEHGGRFAALLGVTSLSPANAWPPVQPDQLDPDMVRQWLVKALYEREDETLTELRPAAALFVRFGGIDYEGDIEAGHKLDIYIRWVQGVFNRHGGTLIQLTTGDKGSYLYGAFGAPIAYDNNAELAANAALDLIAIPPELSFITSVQIGLSQGIMRTGAYGGQTRRTYGVMGDDVNLAARLMQHAANGEILVSPRVHKPLVGGYTLQAKDPIRVKGKTDPIPVSALLRKHDRRRQTQLFERPLVGRTAEFMQLLTALSPIVAGEPTGAIYVWGEPGIGKSHLISRVRSQIIGSIAMEWFICPAEQVVRQSLHPFTPLLSRYFQQELGETDHQKKALFDNGIDKLLKKVGRRAGAELGEVRWFLGALLGLRWPGSPYENLDPKLRFERSLKAVVALFKTLSRVRPVVIHVQDAQWLDDDSIALLRDLLAEIRTAPIAVLMDSRTPFDGLREMLHLPADAVITVLDINRLSAESVGELAQGVLNGSITAGLHQFLAQKANGNPFFTEQLALDLSERGMISRNTDGAWEMQIGAADELPTTINAVLIARLDRLVAEVRSIVQIASVLGHEFESPVLTAITKNDPAVIGWLKQAESESIWVAQTELLYLFRHVLLRDAAYNMQLQERLRELHALAARAIEDLYTADLPSKYPDLAYHYERAELFGQAVRYMGLAARYMMSLYANREAMGYLRRAVDLLPRADLPAAEIAPIYEDMAGLHETFGEYGQAISDYDTALSYLAEGPTDWRTRLLRKKGQVQQKWGRYEDANTSFEAALIELQADLNADEACQIYAGLSMINYRQDKIDDAIELAMLALAMAADDPRNTAQAYQNLGVLFWKKGDYPQAAEYNDQSLALWETLSNLNGSAAVYNNMGLLHLDSGQPERALTAFEQSLKRFEKVGNQHGLACVYDNLGRLYMQKGEEEQAVTCLEQAVTILAKIGLTDSEVFSSMWQSGTW